MNTCEDIMAMASGGVAPALRAVDCVAGSMTADAFNRLFGASGAMAPVLTILLTLYIAFFAISLLTGRSSLGISALTPRMLTLGLVLTFATSWVAYQGVLWNLAVGGPDWIASVLTGADGSATQIFADRIDIVFAAIGQASDLASQQVQDNGSTGAAGMFKPADIMWLGALLLLLGTVGVLLTTRIALAVLLAVGPIFVVMALFNGTRGLTAGWLRGVALTAVTPLFVVLAGGITLEMLVPILAGMNQGFEGISGRAAMALFLIAAVHVALMGMVMKVAGTMVAGWQVSALRGESTKTGASGGAGAMTGLDANGGIRVAPLQSATDQGARRAPVVAAVAADGASAPAATPGEGSRGSDRRVVVTEINGGGVQPLNPRGQNRAQGIGSRFRSASNDSGLRKVKEIR